ncbi:MAG: hypothetical protein AAFX06_17330 [Planctomycetota bacterium]
MNRSDYELQERRPYAGCIRAIAVAWGLGVGLTALAYWSGLDSLSPQVLAAIAVASGFIALLSITPGFLIEHQRLDQQNPATLPIGFSAALLIRLGSTVALMAFGGYQMRSMQEVIAGWVIAWYVYLTTVEIVTLATSLTRQERRRQSRHQPAGTSVR